MKKNLANCNLCSTPPRLQKILLTMKMSTILLFIFTLQLSAVGHAQKLLDINQQNRTIREILKVIESQSDFRFFYNDDFASLNEKVDVICWQKKVEDILESLFSSFNVTYRVMADNMVVLLPTSELQKIQVKGHVIDANTGEPLAGVYVLIEGSNSGGVTDSEGNYAVEIPNENTILVFSYVGYNTERITVGSQRTI